MTASARSWVSGHSRRKLMEPGRKEQGACQAEGVRQLSGQRQGLVAPLPGLVRIA